MRTCSCRSTTRRRGLTQGCGSAQGRTPAVSASTTRATRLARSRQCALRSGAQQGQLDLTACDRHGTRRVGRAVRGGVGLSRRAIACGGGPPPKARKSCTGCAWAMGCGATHGTVARVCCGRQATGATPTVHKARSDEERDRCVTHWRSDDTTGATRRSARVRARAFGMFYWGVKTSMKASVSRDTSALLPRDDAAAEHVWVAPQGPLGSPAPRGPHVEPRGARAGQNRARRVARAVPGGEAHQTKMGDARAERAREAPMDPTDPWGTLGARVVEAKGARGARVGGV